MKPAIGLTAVITFAGLINLYFLMINYQQQKFVDLPAAAATFTSISIDDDAGAASNFSKFIQKLESKLERIESTLLDLLENATKSKALNTQKSTESEKFVCPVWLNVTAQMKQCILKHLKNQVWTELPLAVAHCSGSLQNSLNCKAFRNQDDFKFIVPFLAADKNKPASSDCTLVTLGIGGDIIAERQVKQLYPYCRFYGADPILKSGIIYKQLGQYYQVAVSSSSGAYQASVLLNPDDVFNYTTTSLNAVSIREFLARMVQVKVVDYLFLDAEGVEYKLLKDLQRDSDLLLRDRVAVCQLNVELHGPVTQYGLRNMSEFNALIRDFVDKSDFLPIYANSENTRHRRVFFVNAQSQLCIAKFFKHWC